MSVRDPSTYGKVERHPDICGGDWRIAGTRITTRQVVRMHLESDTAWILEMFPQLVEADITASLEHEERMRELRRRDRLKAPRKFAAGMLCDVPGCTETIAAACFEDECETGLCAEHTEEHDDELHGGRR